MTETESVGLELSNYDGIPLPEPASQEDYPDKSFSDAYQRFREFWEKFPPGDGLEASLSTLSAYAEFMRHVQIPTDQLLRIWKEKTFGRTVDFLPKENALASTVRGIARERYKKWKEQQAANLPSEVEP
jgi:hypothetical protein